MKEHRKFTINWKQNIRRVPEPILMKVKALPKNDVVVGCVKRMPASDIAAGKYGHLQIQLDGDTPSFPNRIMPFPEVGRYSRMNVEGKEIVRTDLPKMIREYSWETPNYGDWSLGSHTCYMDREVYQRDFLPPNELEIEIELLAQEIGHQSLFVFKFKIDRALDKQNPGFQDNLFYDLNLLQENVGAIDVFASDATVSDYLTTIHVNWEILPPGDREATIARILVGMRGPTEETRRKLIHRYNLLAGLKPVAYIQGTCGFRRYFGAKFSDQLVAFENLEYGNAMYVMFEDWEMLSRKTRLELLAGDRNGFARIVHRAGWENQLRKLIRETRR